MKRILILIVVLLLVGVAGGAGWIYRDLRTPVHHSKAGQYIEIPKGSSSATVVKRLVSEGIIKHEWPIQIYLKLTRKGANLKAGEYDFPSPVTPLAALAKLERGERRLARITIVEGWTRWDIAEAMFKVPEFHLQDERAALPLMDNVSLVQDIDPAATNLEGYLYPDTYEFAPESTPAQLIETMVKRFHRMWSPEWSDKARVLNRTPREIVTMASLIETEAKLPDERPVIASVIYNRLRIDMPLAVDSAVIYASKLAGKWRDDGKVYRSDLDRRSPYNTRIYSGLPPGPIASPGESSLSAALNPAQSDYLYYVREPSRNDGAHNFYSNSRDFETGVQSLRKWERDRDLDNAQKKAASPDLAR